MSSLQEAAAAAEAEKKAQQTKAKARPRLSADATVGMGDLMDVHRRFLKLKASKDLWGLVQPDASGPRTLSFKLRPVGPWMMQLADLIFDVLDLCSNTKLPSKRHQQALKKMCQLGEITNTTRTYYSNVFVDLECIC